MEATSSSNRASRVGIMLARSRHTSHTSNSRLCSTHTQEDMANNHISTRISKATEAATETATEATANPAITSIVAVPPPATTVDMAADMETATVVETATTVATAVVTAMASVAVATVADMVADTATLASAILATAVMAMVDKEASMEPAAMADISQAMAANLAHTTAANPATAAALNTAATAAIRAATLGPTGERLCQLLPNYPTPSGKSVLVSFVIYSDISDLPKICASRTFARVKTLLTQSTTDFNCVK